VCVYRVYVADNGSLMITSLEETDSAVFQCVAVNSVGETSATVLLSVYGMFHTLFFCEGTT